MTNINVAADVGPRPRLYVIVQRVFPMGGIETLILRVLPGLMADGDVVVCGSPGGMTEHLPAGTHFFQTHDEATIMLRLPRYIQKTFPGRDIVFVSCNPWSLVNVAVIQYVLKALGVKRVRSFYLVPHSRALFFSGTRISNRLLEQVFATAPQASTYFMNDAARDAHAAYWGKDLSLQPILRLPLNASDVAWKATPGSRLRIVSVGRLVAFKAYNRAAPGIVAALRAQGIDAHWTIWGDGEDRAIIEQAIEAHDCRAFVTLQGLLPYDQFNGEVCAHDVFVGMGTALLEAAQAGVPSICALEELAEQGYGFLDEAPGDSIGDMVAGAPTEPLAVTLRRFVAMADDDRQRLSGRCVEAAALRSETIKAFEDAIITARPWVARFDVGSLLMVGNAVALCAVREVNLFVKRRLATRS